MMYGFHGRYLKHTNSLILPPLSQIHTLIINMFYMTFITCNTMICYTPSSKLRDIDVTMSKRRPDSRTLRTSIFKTSYQYLCVEKVNIFLMKVYNKTVIDWIPGQQQFCLTRERIYSPQTAASYNRSVLGSNKTTVVLEPSQYLILF